MDDRGAVRDDLGNPRAVEGRAGCARRRAKAVHVWLEERSGTTFACPECQAIVPIYDRVERS